MTPERITPERDPRSPGWYHASQQLLSGARRNWKSLLVFSLVGGAIAMGIVLLIPRSYMATAAFQAEQPPQPMLNGSLSGLAAQFGALQLSGGSLPQFYGDLVTSDAVLGRVGEAQYPWKGATTPLATIYGYQAKAPDMRRYLTRRRLKASIGTVVNTRTGVVSFQVEANSPELVKAIAETTMVELNTANVVLRKARASAESDFAANRAESARQELTSAENDLTGFYQRNRTISASPALQTTESRLRRQVDMAQTIYTQLRLQQEQAATQAVRNTPTLTVIDPPLLPVRPSKPKRRLVVLAGIVAGLAIGLLRQMNQEPETGKPRLASSVAA